MIGGQSLALLLTLLVTPVAYSLMDNLGAWVARRKGTRKEVTALPTPQASMPSVGAGS